MNAKLRQKNVGSDIRCMDQIRPNFYYEDGPGVDAPLPGDNAPMGVRGVQVGTLGLFFGSWGGSSPFGTQSYLAGRFSDWHYCADEPLKHCIPKVILSNRLDAY